MPLVQSGFSTGFSRGVCGRGGEGCGGPPHSGQPGPSGPPTPTRRGRRGGGERERTPGDRVLEEAAIDERVHEEREEDPAQGKAERARAPHRGDEEPRGAEEERGIREEPEDAELGGDRERRRVRGVALRLALTALLAPARERLRADAAAGGRGARK